MALVLLLLELRGKMGIVLSVAHVNHKLRARASDADEKFVAKLAATHGMEFYVERVDVAGKARREKANIEDASRRVRNDFFARLVAGGKSGLRGRWLIRLTIKQRRCWHTSCAERDWQALAEFIRRRRVS